MEEGQRFLIAVYLDNGVVDSYHVNSERSAREHSAAIIFGGWRYNDGEGLFEHYPPHRILKVKVTGNIIQTKYPANRGDREQGT